MDKYDQFKPDEETIEYWLEGLEARLLCHNIETDGEKRKWCQALVGQAGRNLVRKLPDTATWDQVKQELCGVLGETDPKERAIEGLLQYKPKGKGLGEIAADIITKAASATNDVDMQAKLGLKAFLKAVPDEIGKELRRKHFHSVREALQEARFLQLVQEGEKPATGQVLTVGREEEKGPRPEVDIGQIVGECLRQFQSQASTQKKTERPRSTKRRRYKCWCCGQEGHRLMQCPTIKKNRAAQQAGASGSESENE